MTGRFEPPLMNISVGLINATGWCASTPQAAGLAAAYAEFLVSQAD